MENLSIYIHIPFCDHKCIYCDFYSIITQKNKSAFLDSLKKEIAWYGEKYKDRFSAGTIFFGGGTPSLMSPDEIKFILDEINNFFQIDNDCEITMESNPGTIGDDGVSGYLNAGINRLSVGIQSFNDDELKFLTRIHNSETAQNSVINAHKSGFENISIDLIFNLPGQTKEKWTDNLETAVNLPVKHISAYSLILERGTILNKMVLDGKVKMQDDDYDAELYEITIDFLKDNGYDQYEVSNFCRPGYECRHNLAYWEYQNYLGLGPSAHSFIDKTRWWNFTSLGYYMDAVKKGGIAVMNSEKISRNEEIEEFVMLGLRSRGLNIEKYTQLVGPAVAEYKLYYMESLEILGLVERKDNFIKFTKSGYAISDEIIASFSKCRSKYFI